MAGVASAQHAETTKSPAPLFEETAYYSHPEHFDPVAREAELRWFS